MKIEYAGDKKGFKIVNILKMLIIAIPYCCFWLLIIASDRYTNTTYVIFCITLIATLGGLISYQALLMMLRKTSKLNIWIKVSVISYAVIVSIILGYYIDWIGRVSRNDVESVVIEKYVKRKGVKMSFEFKYLRIKNLYGEFDKSVLLRFYDNVRAGDTIYVDLEYGKLGFTKIVDYRK